MNKPVPFDTEFSVTLVLIEPDDQTYNTPTLTPPLALLVKMVYIDEEL